MNDARTVLSDDWKRNWQQSIAVKISALALWVVLPISLFIAFYYISDLEKQLEKQYLEKVDTLAYRIQSLFENEALEKNDFTSNRIRDLINDLGFSYVRILTPRNEIFFGEGDAETQFISRTINVRRTENNNNDNNYQTIKVVAYYPLITDLVSQQRNNILYPVIIGQILFGLFLIWPFALLFTGLLKTWSMQLRLYPRAGTTPAWIPRGRMSSAISPVLLTRCWISCWKNRNN